MNAKVGERVRVREREKEREREIKTEPTMVDLWQPRFRQTSRGNKKEVT